MPVNFESIKNLKLSKRRRKIEQTLKRSHRSGQVFVLKFPDCLEFSTTSNTHTARENFPRLVALRNLFAIVFSFSAALPYFGKISEGN